MDRPYCPEQHWTRAGWQGHCVLLLNVTNADTFTRLIFIVFFVTYLK